MGGLIPRQAADRAPLRFTGYAAVFDQVDRGGDVVRAGAFARAGPVPLLWQHRGRPIGVIEAVAEDPSGLRVTGRIDDPAITGMVRARALDGLSVGYRVRSCRQGVRRELTDLDLIEVSLVARPMQPAARIESFEQGEM